MRACNRWNIFWSTLKHRCSIKCIQIAKQPPCYIIFIFFHGKHIKQRKYMHAMLASARSRVLKICKFYLVHNYPVRCFAGCCKVARTVRKYAPPNRIRCTLFYLIIKERKKKDGHRRCGFIVRRWRRLRRRRRFEVKWTRERKDAVWEACVVCVMCVRSLPTVFT